jgi:hypothetical protein
MKNSNIFLFSSVRYLKDNIASSIESIQAVDYPKIRVSVAFKNVESSHRPTRKADS